MKFCIIIWFLSFLVNPPEERGDNLKLPAGEIDYAPDRISPAAAPLPLSIIIVLLSICFFNTITYVNADLQTSMKLQLILLLLIQLLLISIIIVLLSILLPIIPTLTLKLLILLLPLSIATFNKATGDFAQFATFSYATACLCCQHDDCHCSQFCFYGLCKI